MPSATGQNWEKYKKEFVDDEEPEKKITPLTDECVTQTYNYGYLLTQSSSETYKSSRHMALLHTLQV